MEKKEECGLDGGREKAIPAKVAGLKLLSGVQERRAQGDLSKRKWSEIFAAKECDPGAAPILKLRGKYKPQARVDRPERTQALERVKEDGWRGLRVF